MLGKLLGAFDFITGIAMLLLQYDVLPSKFFITFAFYLLLKAIIFFGDLLSILDGIVGLYILLMIFVRSEPVTWIFAVYLMLKSLVSIL